MNSFTHVYMHFIVAIYSIRRNAHKYKTCLEVGSISYESQRSQRMSKNNVFYILFTIQIYKLVVRINM